MAEKDVFLSFRLERRRIRKGWSLGPKWRSQSCSSTVFLLSIGKSPSRLAIRSTGPDLPLDSSRTSIFPKKTRGRRIPQNRKLAILENPFSLLACPCSPAHQRTLQYSGEYGRPTESGSTTTGHLAPSRISGWVENNFFLHVDSFSLSNSLFFCKFLSLSLILSLSLSLSFSLSLSLSLSLHLSLSLSNYLSILSSLRPPHNIGII